MNLNQKLLFDAVKQNNLEKVKILIEKGVDLNYRYMCDKRTILFFLRNVKTFDYLISEGADINISNEFGYTPLHNASFYGILEIVKYLVSKGANVNAVTIDLYTPLRYAVEREHTNVIKYFLSIPVDIKSENGDTILYIYNFLKNFKLKIFNMYIISRFLHQRHLGVEVISEILKNLVDLNDQFSKEEILAISYFGTQNKPKIIMDTEYKREKYLYSPLHDAYKHLFGYL